MAYERASSLMPMRKITVERNRVEATIIPRFRFIFHEMNISERLPKTEPVLRPLGRVQVPIRPQGGFLFSYLSFFGTTDGALARRVGRWTIFIKTLFQPGRAARICLKMHSVMWGVPGI